jgi:uncharacterized protein
MSSLQDHTGFVAGVHLIDSYGKDSSGKSGFRFAEMSHRGSLLMLPSGVYAWDVREGDILLASHFDKVQQASDHIDFLLVGTGKNHKALSPELKTHLALFCLSVDIMSTPAAVRTYNVMAAENRKVAAALLVID